jgi:hypothetical protein
MKAYLKNCQLPHKSPQKGVALVLTLLIISMLVVVVVGFVSVSRLEQMAARNYTYQAAAEQMAQLATAQAMERLSQALNKAAGGEEGANAGLYATESGRLYPAGGVPEPLFSQGATSTNINRLTSYGWVTGSFNDAIMIGLTNVGQENSPVVGRTGFYIGDETSKLPINFAAPSRSSLNPVLPRPFSIKGVGPTLQNQAVTAFSNVLSGSFSNTSISNWSYFFTTEQLQGIFGFGPEFSRRTTVATATNNPANPQTPWGTDKVLINELSRADASVTNLTEAMTDTKLTTIFGSHFGDKYGEEGVKQLAANMIQLRSDHWTQPMDFNGSDPVIGTENLANATLAPAPISGDLKKTNGIPQEFFGYVPFPMLTEVAVSYAYGWTSPTLMTVRIFLECTLYNPYPERYPGGGIVSAQIDKAIFAPFYGDETAIEDRWRGPFGTPGDATEFSYNDNNEADPWGDGGGRYDSLVPVNGIRAVEIGEVLAGQQVIRTLVFDLRFEETNPTARADGFFFTFVIFDQIKLLADAGDPQSVRDWISGYDLFNALSSGAGQTAQFDLPPVPGIPKGLQIIEGVPTITGGAVLNVDDAPPPPTKLVKRFDPRLRLALDIARPYNTDWPGKIWFEVPYEQEVTYTPGSSPSQSLPGDPAYVSDTSMAVYNTNLPPILFTSDSTYAMAADLGKVFTGWPWRTLRMQPQPPEEGNAIPDWVLLDMVDFTDGTKPLTTVNPNSSYVSAGATVAGFGAGLRSQLDVLTNGTAISNVASPLNPALTATNMAKLAGLTNGLSVSNLVTQAANRQWSGAGSWAVRRQGLGFPTTALMLPSEIVEVAGFADYAGQGDNFKLNEYRSGTLFPGLSTKSRFFKIYAVGEALEGATTQNVAATALLQTLVEVDDSTDPISITTIYQYPPAD